ncbi:MAG: hypothetical protein E7Z91_00620 [Cyanobacteria bacterium SIG30]|nr:hypothetical protein [Cyanobacteria bacterium SIG30]
MKIKNNIKKICFALLALITITSSAIAFSFKDITLRFAQISDSHISERANTSYKMLGNSILLLTDTIKQINKMNGLDFIVFTGDMVDEPIAQYWKDFFEILTSSKYPILMAFGNHDLAQGKGEYLTHNEILELIKKYNKNYPFDKTYYAITPKPDFRIITLDLTQYKTGTSNGEISPEQLAFLDEELSKNQDKIIIIFQHFPTLEPFNSNDHNIINSQAYKDILAKYNMPIAIFSGHYHTTKITQENNIIHVSTPSLVTYPNAFRVINITNYKDRVIFDFYFNETTLKNLQEESKVNTISYSTFYGTEKDRSTTITIKKKKRKEKKNEQ